MKTFNLKKCLEQIEDIIKVDSGSTNDYMINFGLRLATKIIKSNIQEKKKLTYKIGGE
jgi:hypothetical protein